MKTVIISDCHMGSRESNYRLVNKFLNDLECDRLILAGDFWDLWDEDADDLRRNFSDTINLLRKQARAGTRIEYILGNHDEDYLDDPVMPLDEIPVKLGCEIFLPNGSKLAVIHGQRFDPIYKKWYSISRMLAWMNKTARKLVGLSAKTFRKRTCTDLEGKKYSRIVEKIHKRAKKTYEKLGYDGLVMGHTHAPTYERTKGPAIDFFNAGDWKWSNTYIEIVDERIELRTFCEGNEEHQG